MIKVVVVKNPFQPWENREIKHVPYGFSARQIAKMVDLKGAEINLIINGNTIEQAENYIIPDNQMVVVSPVVGKGRGAKILGMVVGLALMVVGGVWAAGAKVFGVAASVGIGITTGIAGSFLVSYSQSAYAKSIGSCNYETSTTDATYSWNGVQTMEGQNNPITLTYGKVKSGGQSIGKYINVVDNKEYLNWLVSAGEGELSITDVKLNDNSISYYSGINVEIRNGTNEQSVISNFNDTYFTKELDYQLLESYRDEELQGNSTQGIKVEIEFPNGLYYANNDGGLDTAWVDLTIKYIGPNSSGYLTNNNVIRISGAQSSALRKEFRIDNLPSAKYKVEIRVVSRSHDVNNSRASVRCYWKSATSIVYDDFAYPNIALIGIKALATDQISGSPKLTFMKERDKVWVLNPLTHSYVQKPANNPAWACYDMLHQASRIKNINTGGYEFDVRGVPANHIIYEQFNEWANFCNAKNLKVNIEITQCGEMLETINGNVALCGRGTVVRFGTRYGCIWKCAKQPTQMFGMGNIISGTMQEEFLPTNERANGVELTYNDANMEYERNVISVYSDNYDTDGEEKITNVTYNGITSYEQAYREAKFLMYCNKYQLRTVSFEANIDAIACTVGDVVLVSHDIPYWSNSGRIYKVDVAEKELTLPIELETTEGNFRIMYRTVNDNIYSSNVTILSNENGWCRVRVISPFNANDLPKENDIFDIAKTNVGSKPFEVVSISRASDFTRKIECIEYNANIYNENYIVPEINYSINNKAITDVTNLSVSRTKYIDINGNYGYRINASWKRNGNGTYALSYSTNRENWKIVTSGINEESYIFTSLEEMQYFKVVTLDGLTYSSGAICEITTLDYTVTPFVYNVVAKTNYRVLADNSVQYYIKVDWQKPSAETSFLCAEVWYKTSNATGEDATLAEGISADQIGLSSGWTYAGSGTDSVSINNVVMGDTYQIAVLSKLKTGELSEFNVAPQILYTVDGKSLIPNTPTDFNITFTDVATASWSNVGSQDLQYYEVGYLNNGNEVLLEKTNNNKSVLELPNNSGTVYLKAINTLGLSSEKVTIRYTKPTPLAPISMSISFTDVVNLSWVEPSNQYVKYYELGYLNEDNREILIAKTDEQKYGAILPKRSGTIYIYAVNYFGNKSSRATFTYYKAKPNKPEIEAKISIETLTVKLNQIPNDCVDATIKIEGTKGRIEIFKHTQGAIAITSVVADVYQISACFCDLFGDGEYEIVPLTVNPYIPASLIASESISLEKLSAETQQAINEGGVDTVNIAVKGLLGEGSALTLQPDGSYALVASNGETLTGLFTNNDGVMRLQGDYIHITGQTKFDDDVIVSGMVQTNAITADKISLGDKILITDNLIVVRDNSGRSRVMLGVWESED